MNKITISGLVCSEVEYYYEYYGEKFYTFFICSKRKSGVADYIPCVVPDVLLERINEGDLLQIGGEVRTRNYTDENGKRRLDVSVFVQCVDDYPGYDDNTFSANGFLCKKSDKRNTPNGREITDFILASNREPFYKSDYLPCIAWGRNARRVANMEVGANLLLTGRFQSREYEKKNGEETETMVAFEISVCSVSEGGTNEQYDNSDSD